ncbi:unnamed protein product [Thlaspi arvense]|uniref:RRM domain-containing protein n=1 Tax=Thlaspi arvense TaxID=13288 RepID=A0AAU9SVR6_THLAR|nr:unnamed protein product [Thlaspi arvense]
MTDYRFTLPSKDCLRHFHNVAKLLKVHRFHMLYALPQIVMDRVSDRSKGFGFVTFASDDEARKALMEFNGQQLNGRVIFVDYAKAKPNFGGGGGLPIARGPPEPVVVADTTSETLKSDEPK